MWVWVGEWCWVLVIDVQVMVSVGVGWFRWWLCTNSITTTTTLHHNYFFYLNIVQSLWICYYYCLPQYFQLFSFADLVGNHPRSVQNSSRRQVVLTDHESSWHKLVHLQPRTCKINTRYIHSTPKLWNIKKISLT